jgi:nucleoside-triphosphatase THEP1
MSVQPDDIEPEDTGTSGGTAYLYDPHFETPPRAPWSQIGPDFTERFSRGDQPEHMEITGPSGSGKTHLLMTILQDHYRDQEAWRQASGRDNIYKGGIFLVTKRDDDIFAKMGWPVVTDADRLHESTNMIFWPQTGKSGQERDDHLHHHVERLLRRLWEPKANTVLAFDEVGYIENLGGDMRKRVQQYWREGRSLGISVAAMKQRPQGALRDMHSETLWTAVFKPADRGDAERWAELLGHRRDWLPVLDSLDRARHEFILRDSVSEQAFISWVDTPLRPQQIRKPGYAGIYRR